VPDELRAEKLIAVAHPDFRDELHARFEEIRREFYKS
jgi:acyl-CoA hydrolase